MKISGNQPIRSSTATGKMKKRPEGKLLRSPINSWSAGLALFVPAILIWVLLTVAHGLTSGLTPRMEEPGDVGSVIPFAFSAPALPRQIMAVAETDPVPSGGDAADDPAIWIHPGDPSMSIIIGTDKRRGLGVYNLSGRQLQFLPDGQLNNIDIRSGFPLAGRSIDLVMASSRTKNTIEMYEVDPTTRTLNEVAAHPLKTKISVYGFCMYRSPLTGKYYFFLNSKTGEMEQWELFDDGKGIVGSRMVRSMDVGSQTEGCVADDELAHLYVGEENVGIWKYEAEPDGGIARRMVDSTGPRGHLTADVEGLTLYYGANGAGYLIASSQGNNAFAVYSRDDENSYMTTFEIVEGNGIDTVTHTDGIDVVSSNLGSLFPKGLFVAQDHRNDKGNQNYKLISWRDIESILE